MYNVQIRNKPIEVKVYEGTLVNILHVPSAWLEIPPLTITLHTYALPLQIVGVVVAPRVVQQVDG